MPSLKLLAPVALLAVGALKIDLTTPEALKLITFGFAVSMGLVCDAPLQPLPSCTAAPLACICSIRSRPLTL